MEEFFLQSFLKKTRVQEYSFKGPHQKQNQVAAEKQLLLSQRWLKRLKRTEKIDGNRNENVRVM